MNLHFQWHALRTVILDDDAHISILEGAGLRLPETHEIAYDRPPFLRRWGQVRLGVWVLACVKTTVAEALAGRCQRLVCTALGTCRPTALEELGYRPLSAVECGAPSICTELHVRTGVTQQAHDILEAVVGREYERRHAILVGLVHRHSRLQHRLHCISGRAAHCVAQERGALVGAHLGICARGKQLAHYVAVAAPRSHDHSRGAVVCHELIGAASGLQYLAYILQVAPAGMLVDLVARLHRGKIRRRCNPPHPTKL
mmetsp:Transcript_116861/g.239076  ORF Transcript_116861/g.239076 Transcript_116861/m.239076 type:complete len:257 (+) Transcript_116861:1427-2197(+)